MDTGRARAWPIFLNAGIAGLLLGFGIPVSGIAVWTLAFSPRDTIGETFALAILPFSVSAIILGLLGGFVVRRGIQSRGQTLGRPLLIKALACLGLGAAVPLGFLAFLASRAS